MNTLKSFGCSFVYGSDLPDCTDFNCSKLTWPALTADQLDIEYQCHAKPGQGNFKIYADILANSTPQEPSIFVVNWTWIDRFDYVDHRESWQTLRPAEENQLQKFYYRNLHSQIRDMIADATYIVATAQHLQELQIPFFMTYMDSLLFEKVDANWHNPKYVESLQRKLSSILTDFNSLNFLDWSRANNYAVSKRWHPLEEAHRSAAEYHYSAIKNLM
jgi:hypothetical protein